MNRTNSHQGEYSRQLRVSGKFETEYLKTLQEKTRKRIHFHGTDRKSLTSHVGTKPLPVELGGELVMPNVPIDQFKEDSRQKQRPSRISASFVTTCNNLIPQEITLRLVYNKLESNSTFRRSKSPSFRFQPSRTCTRPTTTSSYRNSCVLASGTRRAPSNW